MIIDGKNEIKILHDFQRVKMVKEDIVRGLEGAMAKGETLEQAMYSLAQVLPDFRSFSTVDYVAYGFNIPTNQIARDLAITAAFVLGLFVIGYFLLRTREVAK